MPPKQLQDFSDPWPYREDRDEAAEFFEIKVLRKHKTALCRQIHEVIVIGKAKGKVLNSKEEYTRCFIPELVTSEPQIPQPRPTLELIS